MASSLLAACSGKTGIVIEITSDLEIPGDVNQLQLQVVGASTGAMLDLRFDLDSDWPHSIALLAVDDDSEMVEISVTGRLRTAGEDLGAFVSARAARSAFRPGDEVRVTLELTRDCVGVMCDAGSDCVAGTCVPLGMEDGGVDAGPDLTCLTHDDCDDGVPCTFDRCLAETCSRVPVDSVCEGGSCDPVGGCAPLACSTPADCDDGMPCNGLERCAAGRCETGSLEACSGATAVSEPGGRFEVTLAPGTQTGSCGGAGSEARLTFELVTTSDVFVSTHQSGLDTVLYVRSCACEAGTEIGCNDDGDGRASSSLQLTALAPGIYNVFVDTHSDMSAMVEVDLNIAPASAEGDHCGNPQPIGSGRARIAGDTCAFADDYGPGGVAGCGFAGSGAARDRVFYFYLPAAAEVTFDGCVPENTMDTVVYVRDVCPPATGPPPLACNDDGCGGPMACGSGYSSSLTTTLEAGLYYLFVDGFQNAAGTWPCPCGEFAFDVSGI